MKSRFTPTGVFLFLKEQGKQVILFLSSYNERYSRAIPEEMFLFRMD